MSLEALYVPTANIKKLIIQLITKKSYSWQTVQSHTIKANKHLRIANRQLEISVIPIALVVF